MNINDKLRIDYYTKLIRSLKKIKKEECLEKDLSTEDYKSEMRYEINTRANSNELLSLNKRIK